MANDSEGAKLAQMIECEARAGYRIESQTGTEAVLHGEPQTLVRTVRGSGAGARQIIWIDEQGTATTRKLPGGHSLPDQAERSDRAAPVHARPCTADRPGRPQRLPLTVRSDRDLGIGRPIWAQQECWELVESRGPLEDSPERVAFLCDTYGLARP